MHYVSNFVMASMHWNMFHVCYQVHKKKLREQIRKSPFVWIGMEEPRDWALENHLVTVIHYTESVTGELMSIGGYMGYDLQQSAKHVVQCPPYFLLFYVKYGISNILGWK